MKNRVHFPEKEIILYDYSDTKHLHPKKFILHECIGEGASCVAYKAEDGNGIPFKLKQFIPSNAIAGSGRYIIAEQRFLDAFKQQKKMLCTDGTANITTSLFGLFCDEGSSLWTGANDVFGKTFDKLLPENALFTNLQIIRRIAESVKAYHENGWLLLDLKPENILVIDSLGISGVNFFDFDSFVCKAEIEDAVAGNTILITSSTENYSAPELLVSNVNLARINEKSDFYSIGAIVFTAAFGRAPRFIDTTPGRKYDFSDSSLTLNIKNSLTAFLHKTLTASVDARFSSDDELISVLDDLIKLADDGVPHISPVIPKPVSGFVGRETEEAEIMKRLDAGKTPLFVCGDAGMGKTQLVLKTAADNRNRYSFHFINYKGNIRDTILSIPFDNIKADGEDVRFDIICEYLKNECGPETVLIIDNFDAPDASHTGELTEDNDFAFLAGLSLNTIFTTRHCFSNMETIKISRLPKEEISAMMSDILPDVDQDVLVQISNRLGGHTLVSRTAAETIREQVVSLKKLLSVISDEKTVQENLSRILEISHFDRKEKRVLTTATLFPVRGLSADVMYSLLSEEGYAAAEKLRSAGWLRFDEFSGLWSMHPLVREACMKDRSIRPKARRISQLVSNLAAAQSSPVPFSKRSQIDEIYANIGKLPRSRIPVIITALALAVATVATIIAIKTVKNEKPLDPELTLSLYAVDGISPEDLNHDLEIVKKRLKIIAVNKLKLSYDGEADITARLPYSALGSPEDTETAIRLFINRPLKLYLRSYKGESHLFSRDEYIPRDEIISVSVKSGAISDFAPEDYGLELGESYWYLEIQLSDSSAEKVLSSIDEGYETLLALDAEGYNSYLTLSTLIPSEKRNCFYIIDTDINSKALAQSFAYSLSSDELTNYMSFSYIIDPSAYWEIPDAEKESCFLCAPEDLPEDIVELKYKAFEPEEISDSTFRKIKKEFKTRLDCLGVPYSFGESTDSRLALVCRIGTDSISNALMSDLTQSLDFSFHGPWSPYFSPGKYEYSVSVEKNSVTDGYELVVNLRPDDSEHSANRELMSICSEIPDNETRYIYLGTSSRPYWLRAELSNNNDGSSLHFSSIPILEIDVIKEEHLGILNLFKQLLISDTSIYSYDICRETFSSQDAEYGLRQSIPGINEIATVLSSQFPSVSISEKYLIDYDNAIVINLHLEPGPELVENTKKFVMEIMEACNFRESLIDTIYFWPVDYINPFIEQMRIVIYSSIQFNGSYYMLECGGDYFEEYTLDFFKAFTSDDFLSLVGGNPPDYALKYIQEMEMKE